MISDTPFVRRFQRQTISALITVCLLAAFLLCLQWTNAKAVTPPDTGDTTIKTLPASPDSVIDSTGLQSRRYVCREFLQALRGAEAAIFDERWDRAEHIADSLSVCDTLLPCALLIRAGSLQARMFAQEDKSEKKQMLLLLDSAETVLESRLKTAPVADSALLLYFMGNCHAYRSIWDAKFGSIISAIKQGFRARDDYQLGLSIDSGLTDLFLGVGVYKYWKSAKSGVLRWSGIVQDERQIGKEEVKRAIHDALISPDGAKSAYMWILMNEKEYRAAADIAEALADKFPHGSTFLWPLATCYKKMNKYTLARDTYLKIRSKLIDNPGNQINLLKVDFEIYQLAKKLEDTATIRLVAEGFESYSRETPRKTRRLLRDEYRILRRL